MTLKELEEISKTHKRIQYKENLSEYVNLNRLKEAIKTLEDSIPSGALYVEKGFDVNRSYGYYDSVEIELELRASYWIEKTPEELAKEAAAKKEASRIAREAAKTRKLNKERAEREEYERLKAKFDA